VNLFPANKSEPPSLRMLSDEGAPLERRYYSQKTEKDLDADEVVRVMKSKKENTWWSRMRSWSGLHPIRLATSDLTRFVKEDSIPPVHFERGYFLIPKAVRKSI